MSNLISKYKKFQTLMKVSVWIWLLAFVMLIVFVCMALIFQQESSSDLAAKRIWGNLLASSGLIFVVSLFGGLITTALPQIIKQKGKK